MDAVTQASTGIFLGDQFNLVTVRIFDEGDHGSAALDRARLAGDLGTGGTQGVAGGIDVVRFQRDMAVGRAQFVLAHPPVVGQLDHRIIFLVTVTDEGQGVLVLAVLALAQQRHAEYAGVEVDGALQIADTQHGMQNSHCSVLRVGDVYCFQSRLRGYLSRDRPSLCIRTDLR